MAKETIKWDDELGDQVVLCADDDADILRVLDVSLEMYGYDAILVHNGKEAIEEFRKHKKKIVAVILDLRMPVKSGLEAARQIRAEAPDTILIALSAYIGTPKDGIHVKECEDAGFNAWTTKPFSIELLVNIIKDELEKKKAKAKK